MQTANYQVIEQNMSQLTTHGAAWDGQMTIKCSSMFRGQSVVLQSDC